MEGSAEANKLKVSLRPWLYARCELTGSGSGTPVSSHHRTQCAVVGTVAERAEKGARPLQFCQSTDLFNLIKARTTLPNDNTDSLSKRSIEPLLVFPAAKRQKLQNWKAFITLPLARWEEDFCFVSHFVSEQHYTKLLTGFDQMFNEERALLLDDGIQLQEKSIDSSNSPKWTDVHNIFTKEP